MEPGTTPEERLVRLLQGCRTVAEVWAAVEQVPELRVQLMKSAYCTPVLHYAALLIRDGIADSGLLFRHFAKRDGRAAARLLQEFGDEFAPVLAPEDLRPLLESEEAEVRLAVIRVAGGAPASGLRKR